MELPSSSLQIALNAIPAGAVAVDADQRITHINKNAAELLQLPQPDAVGRLLPDAAGLAWLGPLLAAGAAFTRREAALTAGQRSRSVLVDLTPLPAAAPGRTGGALVIIREAPGSRDTVRRIEQLESLAGVGEIAAGAIHEIRNPLTSISGFVQLMRARAARQADQATLDYCTLIAEEIGHINSVLSDFLALAKSRSSKFSPVDIGQLIRDVQSLMYGEAVLSQITVVARLPDGPLLIRGNGDKIKEVLINLARNAFQAMPGGGTLTITATAGSDAVRVDLADTGQGMSAAVMAQIFKPFYTTKPTGTGLGLAICRRIIEEHRGKIAVSSEEGKGTTFTLTFPLPSGGDTPGGGQNPVAP